MVHDLIRIRRTDSRGRCEFKTACYRKRDLDLRRLEDPEAETHEVSRVLTFGITGGCQLLFLFLDRTLNPFS
jgi:hypothetical protein